MYVFSCGATLQSPLSVCLRFCLWFSGYVILQFCHTFFPSPDWLGDVDFTECVHWSAVAAHKTTLQSGVQYMCTYNQPRNCPRGSFMSCLSQEQHRFSFLSINKFCVIEQSFTSISTHNQEQCKNIGMNIAIAVVAMTYFKHLKAWVL